MENKEKDKKQLLLRLSPSLWKELMAWAENDFRSLNGQIEYLLTESVRQHKKKSMMVESGDPGDPTTPFAAEAEAGVDRPESNA